MMRELGFEVVGANACGQEYTEGLSRIADYRKEKSKRGRGA